MRARYFLYSVLVLLVGCGADEPPQAQQAAGPEEKVEKPGGVIPEYQLKALEKAKQVEGQLQQAAERAAEAETQGE